MNSINDFAALRPSVEPLDASTADELWARATGTTPAPARPDGHVDGDRQVHVLTALPDDRRPSGPVRRRQWVMAAAAALVVVGVGAVVLVGGGDPTPEALPAAEQPSDGVGPPVDAAVGDRVPEPPLLQVDADGWTMTSFSDEMGAGNGAGTPSSILAPIDSIDRWIRFTELPGDFPTTTMPFDAATDTYLQLSTGDGTLVGAEGWGFDGATFQQIATDALTSGTVPDGYEYLSARDAEQWNRLFFLEFTSFVPARRIGIVLSPGGASQMPDGAASTAEFRIVDQPEDGPRIATSIDGFWGVNVIAHGFESDEELLGTLDSLVEVDPTRFDQAVATLPSVPTASTTPDGSLVSPQCTVPGGCDEPASPRATLDLPGWTVTAADTGDGTLIGAEYLYASDDGRQLQINFSPSTLEARVANEFPDDAVTVLSDTSQVASYPDGRRFRYNAELGIDGSIAHPAGWEGWLIEVDGQPFESAEEFMALVDQIVITSSG